MLFYGTVRIEVVIDLVPVNQCGDVAKNKSVNSVTVKQEKSK